jgi:hypothetical protein
MDVFTRRHISMKAYMPPLTGTGEEPDGTQPLFKRRQSPERTQGQDSNQIHAIQTSASNSDFDETGPLRLAPHYPTRQFSPGELVSSSGTLQPTSTLTAHGKNMIDLGESVAAQTAEVRQKYLDIVLSRPLLPSTPAKQFDSLFRRLEDDSSPRIPSHALVLGKEHAHAAWRSQFAARQLVLNYEDQVPFTSDRRLGGGGVGIVHETKLNGIPLALKRTYTRRLTDFQLNEIKILGRISEKRHHHVVEIIGSYTHRQRNGSYELGLLIWPVARCDLAAFLQDLDTMEEWLLRGTAESHDDISSTLDMLSHLLHLDLEPVSGTFVEQVHVTAVSRLTRSYGCMAEAIAYLHDHGIRRKDLKPSQILLSPEGLWLADFGWSNDMSEYSQSTTSGADNITAKYQAPERASRQPCGRAEDVFALGCCFVEMSVYTQRNSGIHRALSRP